MAETVTLLEHRVRQVVERLRALDGERARLVRELEALRGVDEKRSQALAEAVRSLDALAAELADEAGGDEDEA